MLTGQNGILNRAAEAKEKTETAQEDESQKLKGYEDIMAQYTGTLPSREETKPYFPNSTFSYKEGDLSTGLVIKDSNQNEYVWVEVPTTIYDNTTYNNNGANKPQNVDEWEKIRDCLKAYTVDYSDSSYKDTDTDGTTYSVDYQNMLKSVYTNGGFWIGRYEAGIEGDIPRTSHTNIAESGKAIVKQNKIPYNYVTREEAQTLAKGMNYDGVTSSLIYGLQWDLVLKYIETKKPDQKANLTSDSTKIGNYYNSKFTLNRGKFAHLADLSKWYMYDNNEKTDLVENGKKKPQSTKTNAILLTTGATETDKLQNIYDIAGNVFELTLERFNNDDYCVNRGGSYIYSGAYLPAKCRSNYGVINSDNDVGFRIGLWK